MKLENEMVDKKFNIANLSMSSDVSGGGGSPRKDFSIHGLLAAGMGLICTLREPLITRLILSVDYAL